VATTALTKSGTGTLTLNGTSSYNGTTTVSTGTLVVGANAPSGSTGALGNASSEVVLGTAGGSTSASLVIDGAFTAGRDIRTPTANTTDNGTRVLTLGGNAAANSTFSGNITLGTENQAGRGVTLTAASGGQVTFTGVIQNPASMDATSYTVTKSGLGTVVLSNTNTYSGNTTVSAGTFLVNGSTAAGAVAVGSNSTLGGTGTINGSTTLNSASLAPATAGVAGLLTFGANLTITSATLNFDLGANTAASDRASVTGNLTIASANTLNLTNLAVPGAGSTVYTLFTVSGTTTGIGNLTVNPLAGYSSSVGLVGNDVQLTLTSNVVASAYATWASTAGLDSGNNGHAQDPDGDGVSNVLEFVLVGEPLTTSTSLLPTQTTTATDLVLSFKRSDESEAQVSGLAVQYGANLSSWETLAISAASSGPDANGVVVTVSENGAAPDDISISIPLSLKVGGRLFARVQATHTLP